MTKPGDCGSPSRPPKTILRVRPVYGRRRTTRRRSRTALAAFLATGLSACNSGMQGPVAGDELTEIPADYVMYGMTAYMNTNGIRQGRIVADTAYMFEHSATVRLYGVEVAFFADNGAAMGTVIADRGEWNQRTNRMSARRNAVLTVHRDGARIESQELNFDPDAERIWSDSVTTRVNADGSRSRGRSFESDIGFTDIRIRGYLPPGGQP